MELFILALLYGGGLILAFLIMLVASLKHRKRKINIGFIAVSSLFLLTQYGCWNTASGIGSATGGGGADEWKTYLIISVGIFTVWSITLICRSDSK